MRIHDERARLCLMAICVVMAVASGCAGRPVQPDTALSRSGSREQAITSDEAEAAWGQRDSRLHLEKALELYRELAATRPKDIEILTRLSRGYAFLASTHERDPLKRKLAWEAGAAWGEKALRTVPLFRSELGDFGLGTSASQGALPVTHAAALYWTAVNRGEWANASGLVTAVKSKAVIQRAIQQVRKLDPEFFFGAADSFLGVSAAQTPTFAGGSLENSKVFFESARRIAPHYLGNTVLFVEAYVTRTKDRALFQTELQSVIDADLTTLGVEYQAVLPEQRAAQAKARELLRQIDELIPLS